MSGLVRELREYLTQHPMTGYWKLGMPAIVGIILVDQLSKWAVYSNPVFNARECLDGNALCGGIRLLPFFDLSMRWNRGVSFGALQADGVGRWVLFGFTVLIVGVFSLWLLRATRVRTAVALVLVVGGAIGNLIDRARFGAVVDFLDFSGLMFPWVFNVADAAISAGAVVLLLDQLLAGREKSS